MLNIVLPIAGRGSRFTRAGYTEPKPLIHVHGKPMIELVVENIRPKQTHHFIFVALQQHLERSELLALLNRVAPECSIVPVTATTEGAACTVLLARHLIDNDVPLMLANSDQWVDVDIDAYMDTMEREQADGLVMTMWADHPKWSYVRLGPDGYATEVVEKKVVSNEATVGIYNFRRGSDFVRAADQMIANDRRVNDEFYVAPVYNELIEWGARVTVHNVGRVGDGMWGLGTPDDLDSFLQQVTPDRCHGARMARHIGATIGGTHS